MPQSEGDDLFCVETNNDLLRNVYLLISNFHLNFKLLNSNLDLSSTSIASTTRDQFELICKSIERCNSIEK